jgi:hypothetical protein
MKNRIYRIAVCLILLMPIWANSYAQKTYFVYLQSETQQPFYVLYNSKNFSSSAAGYLILPKLTDGTYSIRIGFPNNANVQQYDLKVKGDDAGYIIKNMGEQGWGLSDLQTGLVQVSGAELAKREAIAVANKELEDKRIADSAQAVLIAAAATHSPDSLLAVETQKATDSVKTATASVADSASMAVVAAVPVVVVADTVAAKANDEKKTETPAGVKVAAAAVPVAAVAAAAASDSAANTNFKSEEAEAAKSIDEAAVAAVVATPVMADSLRIVAEQQKADSIRTAAANAEAQRKIDEAREVMNRTLKQSSPSGAAITGAAVTGAAVAGVASSAANTTAKPAAAPDSLAVASQSDMDILQDSIPADTIVVKIPASKAPAVVAPVVVGAAVAKTGEPKFLDMEMSQDSNQVAAGKTGSPTEKAASPATTSGKTGSPTGGGLTSNNPNTKIVVVPGAAGAAGAAGVAAASEVKSTNSNCKAEAADKDFFALRKKMVAEDDPDEMLTTARKAFKEKCYNTTQVKNLCVLFLTDETKYRFLDMAYSYTTDQQQFKTLVDQLSDTYYINRFNAMIRE